MFIKVLNALQECEYLAFSGFDRHCDMMINQPLSDEFFLPCSFGKDGVSSSLLAHKDAKTYNLIYV